MKNSILKLVKWFCRCLTLNEFHSAVAIFLEVLNEERHDIKFKPDEKPWTLAQLRGNETINFFHELMSYLYNWGLQFFLVRFLRMNNCNGIISQLVQKVYQVNSVAMPQIDYCYDVRISGQDSGLALSIPSSITKIFPDKEIRQGDIESVINFSDFYIRIQFAESTDIIGIFGEIEGNKGREMRSINYWNKCDSLIGIGVIPGANKTCYLEEKFGKVLLLIEAKHYVVSDFKHTIGLLNQLFVLGPKIDLHTVGFLDDEEEYIFHLVLSHWHNPFSRLAESLNLLANGEDILRDEADRILSTPTVNS